MSVDDAAESLRLDRGVVLALETAEFATLGAAVFVKGYLRAYARLLGLNESEVVEGCQLSEPDPEQFRSVSRPREVKPGLNLPLLLLGAALLVLMLAGLLVLWPDADAPDLPVAVVPGTPAGKVAQRPPTVAVDAAPRAVEPVAAVDPTPPAAPTAAPSPLPQPQDRVAPAAPQPVSEPARPPAVAAPVAQTVPLELRFADECWVEISDARRRLLYGLEQPGTVRTFDARLPLRFYLGKTDAVAISVAGVTYNVPPEVRTGRNTARFVVTADDLQLPQP